MRAPEVALAALLLVVPTVLAAEEVQFGARTGVAWSDNVFGVSEDEIVNGVQEDPEDDYSARISPFVAVTDPNGNFTWDLRYEPTYEKYLDADDLDGFDQDASGTLGWRFADTWNFTLYESYAIYQNALRFNEAVGPGEEVTLGFRNQEIRANRTSASLSNALTARDTITLSGSYNFYEYPDEEGNDRSVPSASFSYDRRLSEITKVGTRLSWVQQVYDRGGGDDTTSFYTLSGTLEHSFSPSFRIEASAGPTLVDSSPVTEFELFQPALRSQQGVPFAVEATACPDFSDGDPNTFQSDLRFTDCGPPRLVDLLDPNDIAAIQDIRAVVPTVDANNVLIDSADTGGTDLTYFAHISLIKDWERWNGRVAYDRSNSENARFGSSSVADTLSGTLTWRPRQLWTFGLTAAVSLQEQEGEQVVPSGFVLANAPAPGVTLLGPPPPGSIPGRPCGGAGEPVCQIGQVQRIIASVEDGSEEYLTQSVSFNATRQLTLRSSVFASVYWYRAEQNSSGSIGQDEEWRNLVVWIGLDWKFEPIRF